jgi:uncharacterized protein YkwD
VDHAPATWAEREDQVVRDINEIRSRHALPPLKADPRLAQVARDYSRRMALEKFFEHQSPTGDNIDNRLDAAAIPFISVGENLLDSEGVPQPWLTAAKHWMESEAHRESILDPEFTHTGVGMWQVGDRWLFVQIFLKPG